MIRQLCKICLQLLNDNRLLACTKIAQLEIGLHFFPIVDGYLLLRGCLRVPCWYTHVHSEVPRHKFHVHVYIIVKTRVFQTHAKNQMMVPLN